jgi:DNA polymerase-1
MNTTKICTACPLSETRGVNTVCMAARGTPTSEFMVLFERPTQAEDVRGAPFIGYTAKLFLSILEKAGIPYPDEVYLTYAAKCCLPEDAPKELKRQSINTCYETWLKKEILSLKPKVVVAVGAEALLQLTSLTGIMKHRGTFIDAAVEDFKFKVMPTLSPAYLMQEHRELEYLVVADLKRAYSAVKQGIACWSEEKLSGLNYKIVKTLEDFTTMLKEIEEKRVVACDIETRGKDPYFLEYTDGHFPVVSIQFSTGPKTAWFLPLSHSEFSWKEEEFKYIISILKRVLEDERIFLIGHNFKFDSKWLKKYLDITPRLSFDTMLAHGLFGETSSSLKKLSWEYTDLGGYEEAQTAYTDSLENHKWDMYFYPLETLSIYGCCDADVTFRLFEILDTKLDKTPKLMELFKVLVKASRAFLDIENEGIKIDKAYLERLGIDLDLEMKKLKEELNQLACREIAEMEAEMLAAATSKKTGKILKNKPISFNIESSDHISKLFYERMNMPINDRHRSKKTGDSSVGRKALGELSKKYPIAKVLMEYRTLAKQKEGFVSAYPRFIDGNDKIHPDYALIKFFDEDADKESGTTTGRLSCRNPNLQQVPSRDEDKKIKKLFIPDYSSHYLCDVDYSGIELRVTAMYSQDPVMKKFFNSGKGDFHSYVASKVYGKPEDQISKMERTYAKSTTFGILYGAGPAKIAEQVGCSITQATNFIEEYFRLFPTLKRWIIIQKAFAQKHLYVRSLFGRTRFLPDANSPNEFNREHALKRAINTPIQADASDITLYGLTKIASYLNSFPHTDPKQPSRLRASVHDSILISVHKDDIEEVAYNIKTNILEKPDLDFLIKTGVSLRAEVSIGPTWGDQRTLEVE